MHYLKFIYINIQSILTLRFISNSLQKELYLLGTKACWSHYKNLFCLYTLAYENLKQDGHS